MLPAPCLPAGTTIFEPADYANSTLLRYLHLIGHDPRDTQHFLSTDCRQPCSAENSASDRVGSESLARLASVCEPCPQRRKRQLALAADTIHRADQEPNLLKTNTIYETELACQSTQYLAFNYSTRKMFFQCPPYPSNKISDSPTRRRADAPARPAPA